MKKFGMLLAALSLAALALTGTEMGNGKTIHASSNGGATSSGGMTAKGKGQESQNSRVFVAGDLGDGGGSAYKRTLAGGGVGDGGGKVLSKIDTGDRRPVGVLLAGGGEVPPIL